MPKQPQTVKPQPSLKYQVLKLAKKRVQQTWGQWLAQWLAPCPHCQASLHIPLQGRGRPPKQPQPFTCPQCRNLVYLVNRSPFFLKDKPPRGEACQAIRVHRSLRSGPPKPYRFPASNQPSQPPSRPLSNQPSNPPSNPPRRPLNRLHPQAKRHNPNVPQI